MNMHELRDLSVETESGVKLGKCKEIFFDMDTGRVLQFVVAKHILGPGADLLISIDDVRDVTETQLIVRDANLGVGAAALA